MRYTWTFKTKVTEKSEEIEQDIEVQVSAVFDDEGYVTINDVVNVETGEDFEMTEEQLKDITEKAGEYYESAKTDYQSYLGDLKNDR
jgi:hypothetical protein